MVLFFSFIIWCRILRLLEVGELDGNGSKLTKGASEIFAAYLTEASDCLSEYGVPVLTEKNYKSVLEGLIANNDNAVWDNHAAGCSCTYKLFGYP